METGRAGDNYIGGAHATYTGYTPPYSGGHSLWRATLYHLCVFSHLGVIRAAASHGGLLSGTRELPGPRTSCDPTNRWLTPSHAQPCTYQVLTSTCPVPDLCYAILAEAANRPRGAYSRMGFSRSGYHQSCRERSVCGMVCFRKTR